MPTATSNFQFQKPLVNNAIDADLWGGILNTNWDDLDTELPLTTAAKTSSFSVLGSEFGYFYLVDATSAPITATLPSAASVYNGFVVYFRAVNVDNSITIDGNGAETINGSASVTLSNANDTFGLVCDGSNWSVLFGVELPAASETTAGIIEIATDSEAFAGTETSKALVPSNFGSVSLTANGYAKLPGGLIIQWGYKNTSDTSITFPIAFPTACHSVVMSLNSNTATNTTGADNVTTTGFTTIVTGVGYYWQAIGH